MLIRILICMIIIMLFLLLRKKYLNSKKKRIVTIIVMITFIMLIGIIPIENIFMKFSSPEDVCKYMYMKDADYVVEGNENAIVFYDKSKILIVPATENGWKIPSINPLSKSILKIAKGNSEFEIFVYNYANDYYIVVETKSEIAISDNRNSQFFKVSDEEYMKNYYQYRFCGHITELDENYKIKVDNREIKIMSRDETTIYWSMP